MNQYTFCQFYQQVVHYEISGYIIRLPTLLQIRDSSRCSLGENPQSIPDLQSAVSTKAGSPMISELRDSRRFTKLQTSLLNAQFSKCAWLCEQERIDLGKEIGLSPNQVQLWFKRQRSKRNERRETTTKMSTVFTKYQLAVLNEQFAKCDWISLRRKIPHLAKITGLTETQIQYWFSRQNDIVPVSRMQLSHPFPINFTPIQTPLIPMPLMPMMFPLPSLSVPFIGGLNNRNSTMQFMENGMENKEWSVSPKSNESESEKSSTEAQKEEEELDIIN